MSSDDKVPIPKLSVHQWAALLRMKDWNWAFPKNGHRANGLLRTIRSLQRLGLTTWLEPGDTNHHGSTVDGYGWDLTPEGYALARQEHMREHDTPKVRRAIYRLRLP